MQCQPSGVVLLFEDCSPIVLLSVAAGEEEKEADAPGSPTGTVESGVVTPGSAQSSPRSTTDVSRVVRSLWNGTLGQSGVEPPTSPTQPSSCTDAAPATAGTLVVGSQFGFLGLACDTKRPNYRKSLDCICALLVAEFLDLKKKKKRVPD